MNLNDLNKVEICNRCCIVDVIDYLRHEFLLLFSILKLLFVLRSRYLLYICRVQRHDIHDNTIYRTCVLEAKHIEMSDRRI